MEKTRHPQWPCGWAWGILPTWDKRPGQLLPHWSKQDLNGFWSAVPDGTLLENLSLLHSIIVSHEGLLLQLLSSQTTHLDWNLLDQKMFESVCTAPFLCFWVRQYNPSWQRMFQPWQQDISHDECAPAQGTTARGLSESCCLCKEEWEANYLCNDSTVQISTPKLSSVGTSKPLLSLTRWYTESIYCINKQTWKCMTSRWKVLVVDLFILVPTSKVSEPNTFGSTTKPTLQTKVLRIPYPYCPTCPTIRRQHIFSTHRCEL